MKYLVTARPSAVPIPPEKAVGLFKAAKEWINAHLASGKHDCHYIFPDGGGFAIANADSHEEVMDQVLDYPMYPFLDWEIKALCDSDHSYDKMIEFWQKLAT